MIIAGQAQLSPSRLCFKACRRLNQPGQRPVFSFVYCRFSSSIRLPGTTFKLGIARPYNPSDACHLLQVSGSFSMGTRLSPCRHLTGSRASPGRGPTPQASLLTTWPAASTAPLRAGTTRALHKPPSRRTNA